VSDEELLRSAPILLTGAALQFFWAFHQSFTTWNDLVHELMSTYLPKDFDYELRKEIDNRKQHPNESFMTY
jgi:Retrotransposon gag protein